MVDNTGDSQGRQREHARSRRLRARSSRLIADPSLQPRWDGNASLAEARTGQRVRAVGDVFSMTITLGSVRTTTSSSSRKGDSLRGGPRNRGRSSRVTYGGGELAPVDDSRTLVTHTYDWSRLTDENRLPIARNITADKLQASVEKLAELAEAQLISAPFDP